MLEDGLTLPDQTQSEEGGPSAPAASGTKIEEVFDVVTKPVGSINKKAVAREKRSAERFQRKLQK